jgi:sugar lactone lactonase YvrE
MRNWRPRSLRLVLFILLLLVAAFSGCRPVRPLRPREETRVPQAVQPRPRSEVVVTEVARSDRLWTGIAVSREGRIFVCFPRWSYEAGVSVAEVTGPDEIIPFPDTAWNTWTGAEPPAEHFVCVQSVHIDKRGKLWILDAGSPGLKGVVSGGAKLLEADIARKNIIRTILFPEEVAPEASYLNDVRVDADREVAYITDSGLGALIVVDLKTGRARRVLADHASTKAEDIVLKIDGREWRIEGRAPQIHADGLALGPSGEYLYYHALTGRTLYRIPTHYLRDPVVSGANLAAHVESLYETCAADGMGVGPDGYLYLTCVEDNAVKQFESLSHLRTVVKDSRLKWPDSIAWGPDGSMYITSSQINLDRDVREPYGIFKVTPSQ